MITSNKNSLAETFLNIATNIQIETNFCITHPDYKPFSLPPLMAETLEKSSTVLQDKYLLLIHFVKSYCNKYRTGSFAAVSSNIYLAIL
ncbi:MAG: hypothetical protein AAFR37_03190 [Cyanobacteria bacterium J06628_3]